MSTTAMHVPLTLAAITWDLPRIIGVVSIIVTAFFLLLAVLASRRPSRVRVKWDVARMVISGAAIVLMAVITGVSTPGLAIAAAIAAGVLLGAGQGWFSKVKMVEGQMFTTKTVWGIAVWAIGVIVVQTAGIVSRTGVLRLGQAIAWFGLALLVGTVFGRQQRIADSRSEVTASAAVVILGLAGLVGVLAMMPATASDSDPVWVLDVVETDPGGDGSAMGETVSVSAGPGFVSFDFTEAPMTALRGTYEAPPGELVPWEQYQLRVDVSAELVGGTDVQGYRHMDVIFLMADRWDGHSAVSAGASCTDPIGAEPISCTESMTKTGEFTFVPPTAVEDATFSVGVSALNCGGACYTRYTYRADVAEEPASGVVAPEDDGSGADSGGIDDPGTDVAPSADEESLAPPPIVPRTSSDPEVASSAAMGSAIAGLIAAVAIGLISIFEAGLLSDSLGGRGPWSPTEAAAIINQLFEPSAKPAVSAPAPSTAGPPPAVDPGAATQPIPTGRPTTVFVTGAAAEAAIRNGAGSVVSIPGEQQWDQNASVAGSPPIQTDRVGSHGVIRSVGPVVRGPDGEVSVAVEVDPFEDPPPPPPPDEIQPVKDPLPDKELPPDEEISPVKDPLPDKELPPDEETSPVKEPPPDKELPPDDEPPPPGDVPPVEDEPPAPPEDEPPPPGEEPLPPGDVPPADEPSQPEEPVPDGADGEPVVSDDEIPSDDEVPVVPPTDQGGKQLTDQEIDDIVQWGREHGRSPDDIRADLEATNAGRGGSGPIPLPEPLVQVDTPSGPVTLTAEEAAEYRGAIQQAESYVRAKENIRQGIAELEGEAQRWGLWEQQPEVRAVAGIYDVWERQSVHDASRSEILAEIARLNKRPDPYTFDTRVYSSYAEALADWERRGYTGTRYEGIQAANRQLTELNQTHTRAMLDAGVLGQQERRLDQLKEYLQGLEAGSYPPIREEFVDGGYEQAMREWETRDSHGRYFEDAERTRREITALEASVGHESLRDPRDLDEALQTIGIRDRDQPAIPDVEPALGDDRGTAFDRPARELERIARERDHLLDAYRRIDRSLDEANDLIAGIEGRAGG